MRLDSKHTFAAAVLLFISCYAFSADPEFNSYRDRGAVRGYDVVEYFSLSSDAKAVKGRDEYAVVWRGVTWYFSSKDNLDKFKKDPVAYAPQYGGYCAFAASKNFTTSIRPHSWLIHKGRLYLNHNSASLRLFLKDLEGSISSANENWPLVLERCEKRDNCRRSPKISESLEVLDVAL